MDQSPPKSAVVQLLHKNNTEEPTIEYQRRLTELSGAMNASHTFHKGQFVKWKAGLKNRRIPAYNETAIVRDVLTAPVFETCDAAKTSANPYFREPLNLVLGLVDSDGDFLEFYYDARRLEPASDM
jgi:hypothetical protein